MIRNPINVYPYNNIIDAQKENKFHFIFSGDKLSTIFAELYVKDSQGNYIADIRSPIDNLQKPIYNNEEVEISSLDPYSGSWQNNQTYLWSAYMCSEIVPTVQKSYEDTMVYKLNPEDFGGTEVFSNIDKIFYINIERTPIGDNANSDKKYINVPQICYTVSKTTSQITITLKNIVMDSNDILYFGYVTKDMDYYVTPQYYFSTYSSPRLQAVESSSKNTVKLVVNGIADPVICQEGQTVNIQGRAANITTQYLQAQNIGLKYYTITLEDDLGNIIISTNKIYSQDISYYYGGFINNKTYKLKISLVTQKNQTLDFQCGINVSYEDMPASGLLPIITCDKNNATNIIKWAADKLSNGTATGDYEFVEVDDEHKAVQINSGIISYNEVNNLPIEDNGSISFRVKFNKSTIYSNIDYSTGNTSNTTEGIIANIVDEDESKKTILLLYCYRGRLFYYANVYNKKTTAQTFASNDIYTFYSDQQYNEEYAIQNSLTPNENNVYMWYSNQTNTWSQQSNKYWVSNSTEGFTDNYFLININNLNSFEANFISVDIKKLI